MFKTVIVPKIIIDNTNRISFLKQNKKLLTFEHIKGRTVRSGERLLVVLKETCRTCRAA